MVGVRNTDPVTSHMGEDDVKYRKKPQKLMLLEAYEKFPKGLTAFEARHHAGLPLTSSYWKRSSELLLEDKCLIEVRDKNGEMILRKNPATGSMQRVCMINMEGRRVLYEWRRENKN